MLFLPRLNSDAVDCFRVTIVPSYPADGKSRWASRPIHRYSPHAPCNVQGVLLHFIFSTISSGLIRFLFLFFPDAVDSLDHRFIVPRQGQQATPCLPWGVRGDRRSFLLIPRRIQYHRLRLYGGSTPCLPYECPHKGVATGCRWPTRAYVGIVPPVSFQFPAGYFIYTEARRIAVEVVWICVIPHRISMSFMMIVHFMFFHIFFPATT